MAEDIFKWIRNAPTLNDEQLKQEIDLVHQSSIKAFAKLLPKSDAPKLILTLFAMEHLQSTTLLIQSICFFQWVITNRHCYQLQCPSQPIPIQR